MKKKVAIAFLYICAAAVTVGAVILLIDYPILFGIVFGVVAFGCMLGWSLYHVTSP